MTLDWFICKRRILFFIFFIFFSSDKHVASTGSSASAFYFYFLFFPGGAELADVQARFFFPQVALNWLMCKRVIPIPGARTRAQV